MSPTDGILGQLPGSLACRGSSTCAVSPAVAVLCSSTQLSAHSCCGTLSQHLCEGPPLSTKYLKEPLLLGIKGVLPDAIRERCLAASARESGPEASRQWAAAALHASLRVGARLCGSPSFLHALLVAALQQLRPPRAAL